MRKQVRLVHASLAVAAVGALSIAHVDDPKGSVPHITYMGPGYMAGQRPESPRRGGADGGIAGVPVSFPSSNVKLHSWLTCPQFDTGGAVNTSANTVEGYVSPSGREYAIIGLSDGTGFVDVTNPDLPVIRSFIPSVESLWRDVRYHNQYCYTASEGGGGIQVIDMTNLDTTGATLVGNVTTDGPIPTQNTHTLFINNASGYLYRAGGGNNGLRIYNLNVTPASPQYVTAWTNIYVHEVTVVSYTIGPYAGKEIAFCCGGMGGGYTNTGLYILDVTNKASIQQLAFFTYPNARYCHQGWLSPDKQYFYINDELDDSGFNYRSQTRIVNVSNLSAPTDAGTFTSNLNSIDHNLYTKNNLIFESNYRTGLRVFDATNPLAPVQVGYFDTWPEDNAVVFNGLWDNYPYLPSGIILGADIEKGLFVWSLTRLDIAFPSGTPEIVQSTGQTVPVTITPVQGSLNPTSALLNYSVNGGAFTTAPLQPLGGNSYNAVFPTLTCGDQVRWYVTAQTTSGVMAVAPADAPLTAVNSFVAQAVVGGAEDTLETNSGWVVNGVSDTATGGLWVRADPVGTAAQPGDDHTPAPGVNCWVTGNGSTGSTNAGDADVDAGTTTLTSPNFNATQGNNARISYWRWYSNNAGSAPNADSMPVMISNDGGANWVQLELVTENAGAWVKKSFRIADFLTPSSQIKLRFIARDLNAGSVVEAAVDDVRIEYVQCYKPGDVDGDGLVNTDDLIAVITQWGACPAPPSNCPGDLVPTGTVNTDDLIQVITNWG